MPATRSKKIRTFKKLETLVAYLKEIGISRFDVDATQYDPATVQTYTRPDRAEAMRKAHEAVEHDKWFREQVALSLKEADDPATIWIPHDVAKADMQRQREKFLARIAKRHRKGVQKRGRSRKAEKGSSRKGVRLHY